MKKIYMQPQTDVCELLATQHMLSGSISGDVDGGGGPSYGGIDDGSHEVDVKGNSWGDIWD